MEKKRKVGFATKLLSNHYSLNEVSIEGKTTSRFNWKIGFYDQYVAQVIRTGNCITLLSNRIFLSEDSFWNINYFEDLTKYVFWTFNKSFLLKITEKIELLKLPVLQQSLKLLNENFIPYGNECDNDDEELQFCYKKNDKLKEDPKFVQMYLLDEQNRTSILMAVEKRINEFPKISFQPGDIQKPTINKDEINTSSNPILFLEVLRTMNGSTERNLTVHHSKSAGSRL